MLSTAKGLARRERKTAGQVIPGLALKGSMERKATATSELKAVSGFQPFPREGLIVRNDLISRLREDGDD